MLPGADLPLTFLTGATHHVVRLRAGLQPIDVTVQPAHARVTTLVDDIDTTLVV